MDQGLFVLDWPTRSDVKRELRKDVEPRMRGPQAVISDRRVRMPRVRRGLEWETLLDFVMVFCESCSLGRREGDSLTLRFG